MMNNPELQAAAREMESNNPLLELLITEPAKRAGGTVWRRMVDNRTVFVPNKPVHTPLQRNKRKKKQVVSYIPQPVLSLAIRPEIVAISRQRSNLGILAKAILQLAGDTKW